MRTVYEGTATSSKQLDGPPRVCYILTSKEVLLYRRTFVTLVAALCLLAGCGKSTASVPISASLGAKSLPAIQPPAYIPGPLNGESTPRRLALRRPLAVIVENYAPDSRPQSGLGAASMVLETLAEGGVTRFMAVYLEGDAPKVGPVRSTRMYFDHWASAFHSILVHVGGNDDAQALLWNLRSVYNIDEQKTEISLTNTGTNLFWRSRGRVAPEHTMYVNTWVLRNYAAHKGQNWSYEHAYIMHKFPAPSSRRGRIRTIDIAFIDPLNPHPDADYAVRYIYDRSRNTYLRIMGGQPHTDVNTGHPLRPANVIVMRTGPAVADPNAGPCPCSAGSILIPTVGSGPAWYFRDGTVLAGYWQQKNEYAPLRFYDRQWHQVTFNPGQTWVEVVPLGSTVSWRFH